MGALLAKLRHKRIGYGLLLGLFLNILGWAIILLGDEKTERSQGNETKTKIARIIVGGFLIVIPTAGLIGALSSPVPAEVKTGRVIYMFLFYVALTILGVILIRKGIKKAHHLPEVGDNVSDPSVVTCTNKLCGKEISSTLDKCPFCGTPIIKPTEGTHEK